MNDPRGSIWRKWDLHLHTPASGNDYGNQSITNETIIQKLKDANIAAVAITDHFVMDVDRIVDLQRIAGEDITVFPGIELRSELGGDESIHFMGIFPDRLDVQKLRDIWDELKAKRELTPTRIAERGGPDAITCDLDETCKIIHSLGGIVTIHSGSKTNSIENIANTEYFKRIQKKEIVANSVDIMELGKSADEKVHKEIIFKSIGFSLPLIICSDNHNINDYILKTPCWVKADPTFRGLRQIINEPDERVFIGDEPEILKRVRNNKTKYISALSFRKNSESLLAEKWFEDVGTIPFNPGLVSIIGNKGSGKSALSETIGLLGNSRKQYYFSFLHPKKFCDIRDNKAEHFNAEIQWEDGTPPINKLLSNINIDTDFERVAYIPQNYLEKICSDEVEGNLFNQELESVIFSHVGEAEKLGCTTLAELIKAKTNEKKTTIEIIRNNIHKINVEIVGLEEKLHPNYKIGLENILGSRREEKQALVTVRPQKVQKPSDLDKAKQSEIEDINKAIGQKQDKVKQYELDIEKLHGAKIDTSKKINAADTLLQKIDNLQQQFDTFKTECEPLCLKIGVKFDKIAKLSLDKTDINEIKVAAAKELSEIINKLKEDNTEGVVYKLKQISDEIETLKTQLNQPNRDYQRYLKDLTEWEKKYEAIEGTAINPAGGTIKYYEAALEDIKTNIPIQLQISKAKRSEEIQHIYAKFDELKTDYKQLYTSIKEFMNSAPFADAEKYLLDFNVSIECKGFLEKFFEFIGQKNKGSFCRIEEGKSRLRTILDKADYNAYDGLKTFLESVENNLIKDLREEGKGETRYVVDQLRDERAATSFYDYLYCLEYLTPEFNMQWSGKKLYQLSPGERGMVLLIFYLFIDKSDVPLVIDQPEENLDNESVYKILMSCIKAAKKRRQIIIVTHNPNLAVVCDAEQIIYSEINKRDGNRITYTSGSIEKYNINKKAVDVLEGTRPAFDNRESKYFA